MNFDIRELRSTDRPAIAAMLQQPEFFHAQDVEVALELVDDALKNPKDSHYTFGIADSEGEAVGYVCFGQRPMTVGTFDLYWICVNPHRKNNGVGRALMRWAEEQIFARQGRMVIVETAGRVGYKPTRDFYLRVDYKEEARIKDFYGPADDLVIYVKRNPAFLKSGH